MSGSKFGDFLHKIKDANPMATVWQNVKCRRDAIQDALAGTDHSIKWEKCADRLSGISDDVIAYTNEYGSVATPMYVFIL